jgi:hypothetical protein
MKLISEEISNAEYLVEENNGKKEYKIRGIFLQSDIKNRNGRIYEYNVLDKKLNDTIENLSKRIEHLVS